MQVDLAIRLNHVKTNVENLFKRKVVSRTDAERSMLNITSKETIGTVRLEKPLGCARESVVDIWGCGQTWAQSRSP